MVNQGFDFKSKNNAISLGGGHASASLDGKLMPGHRPSIESFVKMVTSLLDFHADLRFDKNMMICSDEQLFAITRETICQDKKLKRCLAA